MTATAAKAREEVRIPAEGEGGGAWLIVVTKGSREASTRDQLRAQGFEVYLPFRLLDAAQAKRRGLSAVPLFPRILFARATLDADRWQAIFSTYGVQRVMCDPVKPRGVSAAFVERLREREVDGFLRLVPREGARAKDPRKWVKLGDVIEGLLNEPLDERRGSVLVSLLIEGRDAIARALHRR